MAPRPGTIANAIILFNGETSSRLVKPDEVMSSIVNLRPNDEGGLETVQSPIVYQPDANFDTIYGLYHTKLKGGTRDVLLIHHGQEIGEFTGWNPASITRTLIRVSSAELDEALPDEGPQQFPTQFCTTTTGIVIVPQGGRAYFYDGDIIAPLGYTEIPGAPMGIGPGSSTGVYDEASQGTYSGINDIDYAMDHLDGRSSDTARTFKNYRIGTIETAGIAAVDSGAGGPGSSDQVQGWLAAGRWRYMVQFVDQWGNLSALSQPSNEIIFDRQPSTSIIGAGTSGAAAEFISPDAARKQIACDGIPRGPDRTIGRILYRTKDITNTGDTEFYEVVLDAQSTIGQFATLPDNQTDLFCDNIPDAWLGAQAVEVDPVPVFKLCAVMMGRLWIANTTDEPGMMRPSLAGRWGTFLKDDRYWPDPQGSEITGLHGVPRGGLVFTETSTYLVEPNADGDNFRAQPLHSTTGCIAPDSIKTLPNGLVIWLARDGFWVYDGETVQYAFAGHEQDAAQFTTGRLKAATAYYDDRARSYRCFLAMRGAAENSTGWEYDGVTWRQYNVLNVSACCSTQDHRRLGLAGGNVGGSGGDDVWVLDHGLSATPASSLETGWIHSLAQSRASVKNVQIWVRETGKEESITVKLYADWRAEPVETQAIARYPANDPVIAAGNPSFYDNAEVVGTAVWRRRRPFWLAIGVDVPACEVFKVRIESEEDEGMEILGLRFDYTSTPEDARLY